MTKEQIREEYFKFHCSYREVHGSDPHWSDVQDFWLSKLDEYADARLEKLANQLEGNAGKIRKSDELRGIPDKDDSEKMQSEAHNYDYCATIARSMKSGGKKP